MQEYQLGKFLDLKISVTPIAFLGTFALWIGLSAAALWGLHLPPGESILLGLIATLLHWTFELLHNIGHSIAARASGYPMKGIRLGLYGVFATSVYPDEPELPPSIHIRRALGGPIANAIIAIILFVTLPFWHGIWYWLGLFTVLENLVVFSLQIFLPLGFNDGSTILYHLRKIKERNKH